MAMKKLHLMLACMVAVAAIGCSSEEPFVPAHKDEPKVATNTNKEDKEDTENPTDEEQPVTEIPYTRISLSQREAEVANAEFDFAWNLFDKINAKNEGKNVCLSPLSANIALTMLMNGAEGQTRDEIIKALGLEDMSVDEINENSRFLVSTLLDRDNGCELRVANSLWMDEMMPIKNGFKATLADYFDAAAYNTTVANFANDVNAWCYKQTNGLIPKMLQPGESYAWALLNAVYFQNGWRTNVKFKGIGLKEFNNCDGKRVKTDFMQGEIPCGYAESESARHIDIAFGNGAYRIWISLPNEGASIEQCIAEFKNKNSLCSEHHAIPLTMPKFELTTMMPLTTALVDMGINDAFDETKAQFPNISDMKTHVNIVKQGCNIKIDEEGAKAAAVTTYLGAGDPQPIYESKPMVVDRPFMFFIYENSTRCILFMGKIEKF